MKLIHWAMCAHALAFLAFIALIAKSQHWSV